MGVEVFGELAGFLALGDDFAEEPFDFGIVFLDDSQDSAVAACRQRAVDDVVGVFAGADVIGELAGDGADFFGGTRGAGDQLFPSLKRLFAHGAGDGDEHVLLIVEMAIEDRLSDAGGFGDLGGGGCVVSPLGENPGGDFDELFPPLGGF